MYPIKTINRYGIFDEVRCVVKPQYKWLQPFICGYAYAESVDGTQYLINTEGDRVELLDLVRSVCNAERIEFISPNSAINSPGAVIVKTKNSTAVLALDCNLRLQTVEMFGSDCELSPYFGGEWLLIRVKCKANCRSILFHPVRGKQSFEGITYVDPPYYSCDFIAIKEESEGEGWTYFDIARREVLTDRYYFAQSFSNGFGLIQREQNGDFEFVDAKFQSVNRLRFDWADVFRDGFAAATRNDVSGYFDVTGVCRFQHDGELGRFNRLGHAIIEYEDRRVGIFDARGIVRVSGLEACTFFDGDFPFYHAVKKGREFYLTNQLTPVSSSQ